MNRIVDAVLGAANLFRFWFVVDEYERAVVLRLGRYHRDAAPGLHRYCVDVVDARHVLLNLDNWQNVAYQIVRITTAELVQTSDFNRVMGPEFHELAREECSRRLRAAGVGLPEYGIIEFNGPK